MFFRKQVSLFGGSLCLLIFGIVFVLSSRRVQLFQSRDIVFYCFIWGIVFFLFFAEVVLCAKQRRIETDPSRKTELLHTEIISAFSLMGIVLSFILLQLIGNRAMIDVLPFLWAVQIPVLYNKEDPVVRLLFTQRGKLRCFFQAQRQNENR